MKIQIWIAAVMAGISLSVQAGIYSYTWTVGATIPDANPSGYANNQTISQGLQGNTLPVNPYIVAVQDVKINLSGGWNGELIGYLRYQTPGGTGFTTLLNRVGGDPSSTVYTTSGMNVTLIEGAGSGNIHYTIPTSGGTYQVDSTGSSLNFNSFKGLDPTSGTWSIFFADLSGGNVSTFNGWSLDLEVVPEPANVALGIFAGLLCVVGVAKHVKKHGWHVPRLALARVRKNQRD